MNPQQHVIQQLFSHLSKNPHQRFTEQLVANIHCLQDSMGALQAENQKLRQEVQGLQGSQQALLAENQRLQQELKNLQRAQIPEETAHQRPSPEITGAQNALLVVPPKGSCLFFINDQQQVPHPGQKIECHPFMILILSVLVFLMGFYIAS